MRRTYRAYILYERMAPAVNPADRRITFGWKMDTGVSFLSSDMKHAMEMRIKQDASGRIYQSGVAIHVMVLYLQSCAN